jgi:hypothetical protein
MGLWQWFDVKEVDGFADSIVAELRERYPPSGVELPARKAIDRLRKSFGRMFARIDDFARASSLNLYKKARLGNRVKWALKDAGYPEEFVEAFTRELVTHVALARRKPSGAAPPQ